MSSDHWVRPTDTGDDRIVDVSSCSISMASSSRPPSEANNTDSYWFAHTGAEPVVTQAIGADGRDGLKFDEKLRICRERQEEDRQRRLQDIELSSLQKQRYRQQLDDERRRRIDDLKVKDLEKRNAVEERKRLIWEAEQERKEAMVRRSMDRDNKLEAKRLAQRNNSSSFVFGSSTPRTIDLELPALGCTTGQTILFATPNRVNKSEDNSKRRPISAYFSDDFNISIPDKRTDTTSPYTTADTRDCYKYRSALYSEQARACLTMYDNLGHDYNQMNGSFSSATDENLMTQSLVSLQGQPRGRKRHTDLTPALPREHILASSTGRINREANRSVVMDCIKSTPKRAVSMTRLDQLAQPRRRYVEDSLKSNNVLIGNNLTVCLTAKSMSNLSTNNKHLRQTPPLRKGGFKSMTQLSNQFTNRSTMTKTSKTSPNNNNINTDNITQNDSHFCKQNKAKSKSMVQLSTRPPPPPLRHTRASKLRSQNQLLRNTRSSLTLDSSPRDSPLSPTRPISSMSGVTDGTEVNRRVKPAIPRKPRPISIGSPYAVRCTEKKVDTKVPSLPVRDSRAPDKQTPIVPQLRLNRTRSAGAPLRPLSMISLYTESKESTPKPTPPRKPAHVKAAALAKKANKQLETTISDQTMSSSKSKNNKLNSDVKQTSDETSVPSIEPKSETTSLSSVSQSSVINSDNAFPSNPANNKKDVSEDEYKVMMAEKRRLAREQAEREAENERLRLENEKREEEERIKREEEEHKRLEEEQLRLIEIQRKAEEERLQKAMEENRLREEEEKRRKDEELKLRLEKDEKERKVKEEVEQQRRELEERLRRDEEERLQRKKKLEAIMSRTRKGTSAKDSSPSHSPNETPEPTDRSNESTPEKSREVVKNHQNLLKNEELVLISTNNSKPDLVEDVDRAVLQNRNNGISSLNGSHINNNLGNNNLFDGYQTVQRLDVTESLLDMTGMNAVSAQPTQVNPSLDQLINLNYSTPIGDDVNSNPFTNNTFITTNGANHISQEQTITDLLS